MTNDAAVAWLVTNGGESCEPWLVWELSEVKALPSSCIADPLYSATTVAELRAELQVARAAVESKAGWEWKARAEAAERRVAECESVLALVLGGMLSGAVKCKPLMTKWDGDYVVGSLQELIENTLRQEKPE